MVTQAQRRFANLITATLLISALLIGCQSRPEATARMFQMEDEEMGVEFDPKVYYHMIESKDTVGLESIFAPDASLKFGEVSLSGREQIISGYREFLGAMKSYRIDVVNVWRTGDAIVVVEAVARGRNIGEVNEFSVPMVSVFELEGPLIGAQRDYFDPGPMMPRAQQTDPADASGAADR